MKYYNDVESEMAKSTGEMSEKDLEGVLGGSNPAVINEDYRQKIIGVKKDELSDKELINTVGGTNPKALAEKLGISFEELQNLLISDDQKVIDAWLNKSREDSNEVVAQFLAEYKQGHGKK